MRENKKSVSVKIKLKSLIFLIFIIAYILTYIITKDLQIYKTMASGYVISNYFIYWVGFFHLIFASLVNISLYINMHTLKSIVKARNFIIIFSVIIIIILFAFTYHLEWLVSSYLSNSKLSSQECINELYHVILPTFISMIALILGTFIYFMYDGVRLIKSIKREQAKENEGNLL